MRAKVTTETKRETIKDAVRDVLEGFQLSLVGTDLLRIAKEAIINYQDRIASAREDGETEVVEHYRRCLMDARKVVGEWERAGGFSRYDAYELACQVADKLEDQI